MGGAEVAPGVGVRCASGESKFSGVQLLISLPGSFGRQRSLLLPESTPCSKASSDCPQVGSGLGKFQMGEEGTPGITHLLCLAASSGVPLFCRSSRGGAPARQQVGP